MKTNMGTIDRSVRFAIALLLILVTIGDPSLVPGVWKTVAYVVAVVFTLTAVTGVCPLYLPFSISTKKSVKK